jgi:hypothetical protein
MPKSPASGTEAADTEPAPADAQHAATAPDAGVAPDAAGLQPGLTDPLASGKIPSPADAAKLDDETLQKMAKSLLEKLQSAAKDPGVE